MIDHNFSKIAPSNSEYKRIEYLLQLALETCSVNIQNIYSIASGQNCYNFEKNTNNQQCLDSWLESRFLDEKNSLQQLSQRGFDFPNEGLLFPTGQIKTSDGKFQKNKTYEFLMLKICNGKSFPIPLANYQKEKLKLPQEFQSIYLYDDQAKEEQFQHDFILFNNQQVLPQYLVQFEFDFEKEEINNNHIICELCQETKASVYCFQDDANLCFDCDLEHHNKGGKLMQKHIRIPISQKPYSFGKCKLHGENLELYCTTCSYPICVQCKIIGNHSQGQLANHRLQKINDIYQKAINESKDMDPMIEKRKAHLNQMLQDIDKRINEVSENASQVEEQIYLMLQQALMQLQEETQMKMSFLLSDQLEVKRQFEHIQWLESFLKYQQETLDPPAFMNNWSKHISLRQDVLSFTNIPQVSKIQPNLMLKGNLKVASEDIQQSKSNLNINNDQQQIAKPLLNASSSFRSKMFNKHNFMNDKGSSSLDISDVNKDVSNDITPSRQSVQKGIQQIQQHQSQQQGIMKSGTKQLSNQKGFGIVEEDVMNENIQKLSSIAEKFQSNVYGNPFKDSQILNDKEGVLLYLNLPQINAKNYETNVIFSLKNEKSLQSLPQILNQQPKHPNIIIISYQGDKFGGYASENWDSQNFTKTDSKQSSNYVVSGSKSCFLFNLKHDIKLVPLSNQNVFMRTSKKEFGFGLKDLIISLETENIYSEVENTYTTGGIVSMSDHKIFLMGQNCIKPDDIEIWSIAQVQKTSFSKVF